MKIKLNFIHQKFILNIELLEDGYTKNVNVHNRGGLNTYAELNNMDPYQSRFLLLGVFYWIALEFNFLKIFRSIRAKDQFYDDHSHDHKFTFKSKTVTFQENNPYSVNTSS